MIQLSIYRKGGYILKVQEGTKYNLNANENAKVPNPREKQAEIWKTAQL